MELQNSTTDSCDVSTIKTSEPKSVTHPDPSPQVQSSHDSTKNSSPQIRRGRLPSVKPKPNLSRASRSAKTQSSTVQMVEETSTEDHELGVTEAPSAPEETSSKMHEYSPSLLTDKAVNQEKPAATTSDQSHSFSDSQSEPSGEQTNRDMRSTSETSDEKVVSASETVASCSNSSAKSTTSSAEKEVSHQDEVASTSQSRRSRMQKVKPKPNIPQTSRTARATPNTTKDLAEKDSNPTPVSKAQVEQEETCGTSPQKPSQNVGAASSPLDLGPTVTPVREQSTTEENRTDAGLIGQVCPVATTSDQSALENKSSSEGTIEQSSRDIGSVLESTDAKGTTSESCSNLLTSDSPVTESQVGQDLAPIPETSVQPATCVRPGEDLPDTQKAETEVASSCQSSRSRFQKVKPKPNLSRISRTARSAPQTTKDSTPTPTSKVLETPTVEVQTEATSDVSNERPSQSSAPVSVFVPSTKVDSATEEKRADVELGAQMDAVAATSDQSASENQSLSQDLFEQSSTDAGTTALQVGQDMTIIQESSDQPVEKLPDTQKEETEVKPTAPTRMVRSQKVKPKPNLAQTTRTARSKPQTAEVPVEQPAEGSAGATSKSGSTDSTQAEVEAQPVGSIVLPVKPSENTGTASVSVPSLESSASHKPVEGSTSTPTVPQRRRQALKVKPNLRSPLRATQTKAQQEKISEQASANNSQTEEKLGEKDHKNQTETQCPSNTGASSTKSADSEKKVAGTNEGASSDDVVVGERQSVLMDSVPENTNSEKSTCVKDSMGVKMSQKDWVEAGPSSQGNLWEMDMTPRVTMQPNTQPLDVPDVQSLKDNASDSKIIPVLSTDACSKPDAKESFQPCDSGVKGQDAAQERSQTSEAAQTSNDNSQSR